jgi:leucyl/phenylalanyl-tRNA--protein transferase
MAPKTKGFGVDDLIEAYHRGLFPMAENRTDQKIMILDPPKRGILPLEHFHIPKRLKRTYTHHPYQIRVDRDFSAMMGLCAQPVNDQRLNTWISHPIEALYRELYVRGFAHSVEIYDQDILVGGLYGVSIGGAFFGESMVSLAKNASKIALVHLTARLIAGGYCLLDCQFTTEHLRQFGIIEIDRSDYHIRLDEALAVKGDFYAISPSGHYETQSTALRDLALIEAYQND